MKPRQLCVVAIAAAATLAAFAPLAQAGDADIGLAALAPLVETCVNVAAPERPTANAAFVLGASRSGS